MKTKEKTMTFSMTYRFANRQTEQFVENFEDELTDFYNMCGDITFAKVQDLFFSEHGVQPTDHFLQININSIREYFDELAERAYYRRLDDMNG